MWSAWSRSIDDSGSTVTNAMSVRSRSGSLGLAAARVAASSTSGSNAGVTSSSDWIREIPSRNDCAATSSRAWTRTTRLEDMPPP